VIAINTDGPSLPVDYLTDAVQTLEKVDLVLGPGEDGGYYLVGMKQPRPEIFKDIPWSTREVLSQTLKKVETLNLTTDQTPYWYDVDILPDLLRLQDELTHIPADRLVYTRYFFQTHWPKE